LIRVPLPANASMALTQMPQGWRIAALTMAPKQQPIVVSPADGHLNLAAEQSGDVVSLADPDTGATLLVGTQHRSGQGLVARRRGTEFVLRPTIQGVVVEPLSDSIVLKQVPTGFTLTGGPAGLALSPPTSMTDGLLDAAHLTRRLDFSTIPPDALLRRATKQIADAAASPPMARGYKNHIAAASFIALGLAAEGESLLQMAAEQDPKEAASSETGALTAIAALLAGRPDDAGALMDPRLDGTDEISLWRAVRQAMQDDGSPGAAAVFAATAPLVFQYPKAIREHILPLIVETMIKGGEIPPAEALLKLRKNDPDLAYARALIKQAEGDTDEALGMLDALANGHDQFDRARAAVRAVELRLTTRKLDKKQAADAFDKLLYVWRGDARELALRERIAELRSQTGSWHEALAGLRQAETDFPEQIIPIHQRLKDMFAGMIRDQGEQQAPPIEFVSMVDENADLMLDSGDDQAMQQSLADRLLALDLPARAKPVLEKLMKSAKSGVAKARFGVSLATLESREGNDAAVRSILDGSEGRGLPADLVEQRTILRAGSVAHLGDPTAAVAMLTPIHTSHATEARAQILENASDWTGAEQAWADSVALTLPESGPLDEAQARTVLRLATATARAGDDAGLADLRVKYGDRIGASPFGDMFRLLTAEPIKTNADIKRSQQEMSLAASLPANLKALQAR
jgi:tetratricopeptide (TPR) repeat protein